MAFLIDARVQYTGKDSYSFNKLVIRNGANVMYKLDKVTEQEKKWSALRMNLVEGIGTLTLYRAGLEANSQNLEIPATIDIVVINNGTNDSWIDSRDTSRTIAVNGTVTVTNLLHVLRGVTINGKVVLAASEAVLTYGNQPKDASLLGGIEGVSGATLNLATANMTTTLRGTLSGAFTINHTAGTVQFASGTVVAVDLAATEKIGVTGSASSIDLSDVAFVITGTPQRDNAPYTLLTTEGAFTGKPGLAAEINGWCVRISDDKKSVVLDRRRGMAVIIR